MNKNWTHLNFKIRQTLPIWVFLPQRGRNTFFSKFSLTLQSSLYRYRWALFVPFIFSQIQRLRKRQWKSMVTLYWGQGQDFYQSLCSREMSPFTSLCSVVTLIDLIQRPKMKKNAPKGSKKQCSTFFTDKTFKTLLPHILLLKKTYWLQFFRIYGTFSAKMPRLTGQR